MTIKELITIMNITDVSFVPQMYGNDKEKLPIYPIEQGIAYYYDESIWSIGINEQCEGELYRIKRSLKRIVPELENNERELDKYVAVYILLMAIDQYKGGKGEVNFDVIRYHVEALNKAIYEALDFRQVSDMADLKKVITSSVLYREMLFCVQETDSTKAMQYTGHTKERKQYSFGNLKYHEELDRVSIDLYDDCIELLCMKEGRGRHRQELDIRREYTPEEKILTALGDWRYSF